jgi:hypothetical protein
MGRIFIRPVKPEDAPLFKALFRCFRPRRFTTVSSEPLKEMNPEMLARFTQIDYDREIALVAIDEDSQTDSILGLPESSVIRMAKRVNSPFWWGCLARQGHRFEPAGKMPVHRRKTRL